MCLYDLSDFTGITRADALKSLAALGSLPLLGGIAPSPPEVSPVNNGAAVTALVGATAFLGDELSIVHDSTIVLRGNRILAAGPSDSVLVPSGAQRITVRDKFVLPGLIDSHVHFFQSGGLFTRPDIIDLRAVRPYTEELAWIDAHLDDTFARYLRAGITSVSDVGGPFWNYDVRARAARMPLAPRVAAAGPLISSVDRSILSPHGDPPIVKIDSPDAARALVRREAQYQTDFVKMWWIVTKDHPAAAFVPVAHATVAESRAQALRVAIHALELETARLAAEAGTDVLVHSVFDKDVDDAFVALLKERNIILCPTIRVLGGYETTLAERPELSIQDLRLANPETVGTLFMLADLSGGETPSQLAAAQRVDPAERRAAAMRNLRRLHDAGVTIAAGTDAGNIGTLHASSLYAELETMVQSGVPERDVLIMATLNGAKHMARDRELGTIAPGKLADLVVLDENPVDDIRNISSVGLVVKDGRAYHPGDLVRDTPEQLAQRHVNAFNAHKPAALAELYSPDGYVDDRGTVVRTPQRIDEYFASFFARNPIVHAKITARTSHGSRVTLRQQISSLHDGSSFEEDATFSVSGAFIAGSRTHQLG
ncbi:MAG TPA: amidohydrolase family protein [Candidatus Cybelea sp.]